MTVNNNGSLSSDPLLNQIKNTKQVFEQTKNITSIFIDNAIKTEGGYLITTDNLSTTTKKLINYLKQKK